MSIWQQIELVFRGTSLSSIFAVVGFMVLWIAVCFVLLAFVKKIGGWFFQVKFELKLWPPTPYLFFHYIYKPIIYIVIIVSFVLTLFLFSWLSLLF